MTQFQIFLFIIAAGSFVSYIIVDYSMHLEAKRKAKEERDAKILYLLGKDFSND